MKTNEKFRLIFNGLEIAYGQYIPGKNSENGKLGGQAFTKREPLTLSLFTNHLEGKEPSLGVIPIKKDSTCCWGCIDIDSYNLKHLDLVKRIQQENFPLITCRSKSGGAHLFLFIDGYIKAEIMINKLREIASYLGHSDCEIFPKQSTINVSRGDTGNFLNLPYFGGDATTRYAFDEEGKAVKLEHFLKMVDSYKIKPEDINNIKIQQKNNVFSTDGPPCLEHLVTQGFPEGTRNNGLFNVGVYYRKKEGENWETKVEEFNYKYMKPPLTSSEVQKVIKSINQKDYNYSCKKEPICSHCNSSLCRTKKYGIGNEYTPEITSLRKLDSEPPLWFVDVADKTVECESDELHEQKKFQRRCMDVLNMLPPRVSDRDWTVQINVLLQNVEIIEAPKEAGLTGQMEDLLHDFCTRRGTADNKEEILMGKPWRNETRIYFRLRDFYTYCIKNNFKAFGRNKIASRLRNMGSKESFFNIKGHGTNVVSIPGFDIEDFSTKTPNFKKEQPF